MLADLKGIELNVASNQLPPYFSFNGTDSEGIESHILKILSYKLNFTYQFIDCNYHWGKLWANHTWDGIIGKVWENKTDIGIAGVTMNAIRYQAIKFTYPHYIDSISFTSPLPEQRGYSLSLLKPFEEMVWISLILFMIFNYLFNLILKILLKINVNINWKVISIVLSQSLKTEFSTSFKALMCGWLLSSMVLRVHYSGCLYTSMTFPEVSDTIESLNELALAQKNGKIQTIMLEGTAYSSDSNTTLIVSSEFQNSIIGVSTHSEGFQLLKRFPKKYIFIAERIGMEYNIRRLGLLFYLPPSHKESNLFLDIISIAVSKNFRYINEFNEIIHCIQNSGLIEFWKKRFYWKYYGSNYRQLVIQENNNQLKRLDLDQLENSFYLCLAGLVFSLFTCFIEYCSIQCLSYI